MRCSAVVLAGFVGLLGLSFAAVADPGAPAAAAPAAAAPAAAPAVTAQVDDPNEVICKTMAPTTGTRLGARRECQTRREWDADQARAEQNLRQQQNIGNLQPGMPGG